MKKKKPRNHYVYVGYKEKFQGVTYEEGGEVYVHLPSGDKVKADSVFSQKEYVRNSGKPKVTSAVSSRFTKDIQIYIASNFDAVIAIDTNSVQIGSNIISVAITASWFIHKLSPSKVEFKHDHYAMLAFKDCPIAEAEKFALYRILGIVTSQPTFSPNIRVAVITDHDLMNHSKYNAGELPVYRDFYLPKNFSLIYASAETGADSFLNNFIATCDKESTKILDQLRISGNAEFDNNKITLAQIPSACS